MSKQGTFLRAAEQLQYDSIYSPIFAEPLPDWFGKVAIRFSRVLLPDLKPSDGAENHTRFFGHLAGFIGNLDRELKAIKSSEISRGKNGTRIRREIGELRKVGGEKLRNVKSAAGELPAKSESEFYEAYAKSVRKDSFGYAVQRLRDSNTVRICFFLMCMRPHIEAGKFSNITGLVNAFIRHEEQDPRRKKLLSANEAVRKSLEQQFRDICSEDSLKLQGKGRPKKNSAGAD
jgi:hypothetical protein